MSFCSSMTQRLNLATSLLGTIITAKYVCHGYRIHKRCWRFLKCISLRIISLSHVFCLFFSSLIFMRVCVRSAVLSSLVTWVGEARWRIWVCVLRVDVCTFTHKHVGMRTHIHIYTYKCSYTCIHVHTYIHMFVHIHTHTCIYTYIHVRTFTDIHLYIRRYWNEHVHIHTNTHI